MAELTPEELQDQLELARQRFEQVTEQIRTVLVSDASHFIIKSAKSAFLNQPEVSDALSDTQLADFKGRGRSLGSHVAQALEESLADDSCWRSGPVAPTDERSLADVEGVWGHLMEVGAEARSLLEEFGYEAGELAYALPKYFVSGLYLPTLIEHFWRLRQEMGALDEQRADLKEKSTRRRLQARWDEVEG